MITVLGGGSKDETIADSREGKSERRLRRKMTCGGVCVVSGTTMLQFYNVVLSRGHSSSSCTVQTGTYNTTQPQKTHDEFT